MNDFRGVDVSELDELAADLTRAGVTAGVRALGVARRSGEAVRDNARQFAPGAHGGRARHYPESITFDVTVEPGAVVAEIGPEKRGQGNFGHLFEYGIESRSIPPQAHLGPAIDREAPNFAAALEALGGEIVGFR